MSLRFVSLLLALLLASPATAFSFTDLFVFGDSIVDTGNTQALVVGAGAPDPAPASLGYFDGRFTNGINPADVLNQAIEGTNISASLLGGDNYSYGGARGRSNDDGLLQIPDLAAQVGEFMTDVAGAADPNALYAINVGGNDIRDILIDGLDAVAISNQVAAEIALQISVLTGAGAQHILVVGVGDVGSIPEIQPSGPTAIFLGNFFSEQLNSFIQGALPSGVTFFDTIALQDALVADPTAFGLPAGIILDPGCLASGAADPGGAPTCNDYGFFDNIHPTTQVMQVLGAEMVAAVPEPGTGLLLMMGLVGIASRRRAA